MPRCTEGGLAIVINWHGPDNGKCVTCLKYCDTVPEFEMPESREAVRDLWEIDKGVLWWDTVLDDWTTCPFIPDKNLLPIPPLADGTFQESDGLSNRLEVRA